MWKLLQLSVFLAVVFSNIHWQWTPNGYLASVLGIGAAFVLTLVLFHVLLQDLGEVGPGHWRLGQCR
jgi:hypothetical protein